MGYMRFLDGEGEQKGWSYILCYHVTLQVFFVCAVGERMRERERCCEMEGLINREVQRESVMKYCACVCVCEWAGGRKRQKQTGEVCNWKIWSLSIPTVIYWLVIIHMSRLTDDLLPCWLSWHTHTHTNESHTISLYVSSSLNAQYNYTYTYSSMCIHRHKWICSTYSNTYIQVHICIYIYTYLHLAVHIVKCAKYSSCVLINMYTVCIYTYTHQSCYTCTVLFICKIICNTVYAHLSKYLKFLSW